MSRNDLRPGTAIESQAKGHPATGTEEAGRASQSGPSENHIGLNSSRLNPAGRSESSHVLLNVDGSLAVTPEQIRYAQERGQRQDSLSDQMATVLELAVAHGCYDAHTWISRRFYGDLA